MSWLRKEVISAKANDYVLLCSMKKFTFLSLVLAICMLLTSQAIAQQAPASNNAPAVAAKTSDDGGINWYLVAGFVLVGLTIGAAVWKRDELGDFVGTSPTTGDWFCTVDTCQRMGQYGLLMTGVDGKSYTLELGALITGGQVRPNSWREAMDEIGTGSELRFLVRASDIMESRSAAIPIMRLNSYTKKTLHYGQDY